MFEIDYLKVIIKCIRNDEIGVGKLCGLDELICGRSLGCSRNSMGEDNAKCSERSYYICRSNICYKVK